MSFVNKNKALLGAVFLALSGANVALCGQQAALHTISFCHYSTMILAAVGSALGLAGVTNSDQANKAQ